MVFTIYQHELAIGIHIPLEPSSHLPAFGFPESYIKLPLAILHMIYKYDTNTCTLIATHMVIYVIYV